jgi:hypothetical protein
MHDTRDNLVSIPQADLIGDPAPQYLSDTVIATCEAEYNYRDRDPRTQEYSCVDVASYSSSAVAHEIGGNRSARIFAPFALEQAGENAASRYVASHRRPNVLIQFAVWTESYPDLAIMDWIQVNYDLAEYLAGTTVAAWIGRIVELEKGLLQTRVVIATFGDLGVRGGTVLANTSTEWATATDTEKANGAYITDNTGVTDATEGTFGRSVIS